MSAGRKRAFDKEQALDKAMRVFWENGYAGTSLAQLTSELGINKPSLYAAFGNKEQLFSTAMERYMDQYSGPNFRLLTDSSDTPLTERLKAFLFGVIDTVSDADSPKGCMFVRSSCESGGAAIPTKTTSSIQDKGLEIEMALTRLLEAEQLRGQLPEDIQVKDLAGYLLSVMYGLGVLARGGKTKKEMQAVANMAVLTLPGTLPDATPA